jgi:hypothetical protein
LKNKGDSIQALFLKIRIFFWGAFWSFVSPGEITSGHLGGDTLFFDEISETNTNNPEVETTETKSATTTVLVVNDFGI